MFDLIIEVDTAETIMERYMHKFIWPDYEPWNKKYNLPDLPWCYFKVDTKILDISEFFKVDIPPHKTIYCHDERQKVLYQTTFADVYNLVTKLEPWDEVDLELFDNNMAWTIAVTHEGELITHGVDIKGI